MRMRTLPTRREEEAAPGRSSSASEEDDWFFAFLPPPLWFRPGSPPRRFRQAGVRTPRAPSACGFSGAGGGVMGRHGKSQHQKRARAAAQLRAQEAYATAPHSFVFARGPAGPGVRQLSLDVRRVMEPYTASSLQVRRRNSLKDCVAVAGPLGVSHFLIFSKTEKNVTFRLIRLPGGPTLTFRVNKYSLVRDVVSSLRRHRMHEQQFSHPPLLVLNGFGPHGLHVKLTASVFQNMFPSINVHKVNLNCVKRCLLLSYDPDSQEFQFRHYSLKVVPVGASRGMKKLLQEKFPNMSRLEDVSELLATGAGLSESEAEPDGEHNVTELPQALAGRGNMKAEQSAVRLTEIGPRITLQLIKIQEGVGDGNVLYHSLVHKSEEELKATLATREQKLLLKAERRSRQEQDIKRKKELREAHRKRSLEGMQHVKSPGIDKGDGDSDAEDPGQPEGAPQASDEEDEAEYFRQAVGEEPDEDMFPKVKRRRPNKSPEQSVSGDQRPGRGRKPHPKGRFRAGKGKQLRGATAQHFPRGQALGRASASKRPHHKSSAASRT